MLSILLSLPKSLAPEMAPAYILGSGAIILALVAQCAGASLPKGHATVHGARYVKSLGGSTPEVRSPAYSADENIQCLGDHVA